MQFVRAEHCFFRDIKLFIRWTRVGMEAVLRSVAGGAGKEGTVESHAFA